MTDVPEHLLRRSKERRAALGLGEGDDAGSPPASPGEAPGTGAAASAVEPAGETAPATQPAAPPAVVEPPAPLPPYVEASLRRRRIPRFAVPVLVTLPLWAIVYTGTMAKPAVQLDPQLAMGKEGFLTNCSGCHGAAGEGGAGRPLGEVLLTFPNVADHLAWVHHGSPAAGTPYGDPKRPGGQRISQSGGYGAMPAFAGRLTDEEIAAIVRYEREVIGGEAPQATGAGGDESTTTTSK